VNLNIRLNIHKSQGGEVRGTLHLQETTYTR